jgi:hypothetical protein
MSRAAAPGAAAGVLLSAGSGDIPALVGLQVCNRGRLSRPAGSAVAMATQNGHNRL